jgi:hypothetical protein
MAPWIATLISSLIAATVVFIMAGFGAAVAWGRIKQTLDNYSEKFTAVSSEVESLKRGLYNPDGTLIYVAVNECEKRRNACDKIHANNYSLVCKKIDEMANTLHQVEIDTAKLTGRQEVQVNP